MSHPLVVLARSRVGQIEYCADCNVLHVTVGPVTVRLEPNAATQLRDTMNAALERWSEVSEDPQPTGAILPNVH